MANGFARATIRILSCALLLGASWPAIAADELPGGESRFLSRVRQLTFEGRRAGEGYFSPDGKRLVFQSEREPGNPFYQIYLLDLETGDTRRISPGVGKTTCSFIRPGTGEILYASTHHDPQSLDHQRAELELRASGRQRRYEWDYDPEMELYLAPADGGEPRRLTHARGYDAEASFSPDGEWIVFSSNRFAYAGRLLPVDQERLERDPSYFLDLYVMRADGSALQRLTKAPGYDGGPFFNADGSRIFWRRFDESGLIADVWSMRPDGTDKRRITDFGAMSWAPYPHPSGKYVLFTSNKLGFDNFELFIVDTQGTREPVRVTYTPGFDGLPVPSPDGRHLAWTTNRNGTSAQIFVADWNHEAALRALAEAPLRGEGAAPTAASAAERLRGLGAVPLPGHDRLLRGDNGPQHVLAMLPAASGPEGNRPGTVVVGACGARDQELVDLVAAVAVPLVERPPERPVALALWATGDDGCLGSGRELAETVLPFRQTLAYIGLDLGGDPAPAAVVIGGASTNSAWRGLIERSNVPHGLPLALDDDAPRDPVAEAYSAEGVPALSLHIAAGDGQAPRDDLAGFIQLLVAKAASADDLTFAASAKGEPTPAARRPFTGTVPDYAGDADGLRLEGVVPDGPADRAGVRPGDVIVRVGQTPIHGIQDYARVLDDLEIGVPVVFEVRRGDDRLSIEITPEARAN